MHDRREAALPAQRVLAKANGQGIGAGSLARTKHTGPKEGDLDTPDRKGPSRCAFYCHNAAVDVDRLIGSGYCRASF